MKTKEELEAQQEAARKAEEAAKATPSATTDEAKTAALAKELGISVDEIESAKIYSKRKAEIEKGVRKHFDKKEDAIRKKEEALDAKLAELEKAIKAKSTREDDDTGTDKLNDIKQKLANGDISAEDAITEMEKEYGKKHKEVLTRAEQIAEEKVRKGLEAYTASVQEEADTKNYQEKREASINSLSSALAKKYGCSERIARSVFRDALEESENATEALNVAKNELAKLSPAPAAQPEKKNRFGLQPIATTKPAGAEHLESHPSTIEDAINSTVDKLFPAG